MYGMKQELRYVTYVVKFLESVELELSVTLVFYDPL